MATVIDRRYNWRLAFTRIAVNLIERRKLGFKDELAHGTRAETLKCLSSLHVKPTSDTLSIYRSYLMKAISSFLAMLAVAALVFSPSALHAQDQAPPPPDQGGGMAPPPPDGQGAPPPDGQGAPPPPDGQGGPPPDQGQGGDDSGASFDQFYNGLSNDGQWVQTQDYGYAFQPNVQDPNWAPYTDGHWVYTAYGWTWA